jgi:hypothetical protein
MLNYENYKAMGKKSLLFRKDIYEDESMSSHSSYINESESEPEDEFERSPTSLTRKISDMSKKDEKSIIQIIKQKAKKHLKIII